jgi:hypothetical protein
MTLSDLVTIQEEINEKAHLHGFVGHLALVHVRFLKQGVIHVPNQKEPILPDVSHMASLFSDLVGDSPPRSSLYVRQHGEERPCPGGLQ